MDYDLIRLSFKILSILIAGILGVMGFLFNFRNYEGKVTRAGKGVLTALVVATFCGLISTII